MFFMFGPRDEKEVMLSPRSLAPTVIALRDVPGLAIVWKLLPLFPAAMANVTPAAVALSIAIEPGSSGLPLPPRLRLATST